MLDGRSTATGSICHQVAQLLGGWTGRLQGFNKAPGSRVPQFKARVHVSLRPSVLDPAGEATRAAAARLGVGGVSRLRIGKAIDVELEATDPASAQKTIEFLGERLLANPVIENWRIEQLETVTETRG